MHLIDLHVPTSRQSLELNPDPRYLVAAQAKCTAASDLRHCATGAGLFGWYFQLVLFDKESCYC